MTGPALGTLVPGADPVVSQDRLAVLIGSHWDEEQRVEVLGVKSADGALAYDIRFRASRACQWVRVHVQTSATGGRDYDAATSVSSTQYDMRSDRQREVEVSGDGALDYYVFLIPEFEDTDGTFTKYDGVDGDDHMAYLSLFPSGTDAVIGPSSATDNAVVRYDGTTGELVQDSGVLIDDSDNVTGLVSVAPSEGGGPTAAAGSVRLANNEAVKARNAADTGDHTLFFANTSGELEFGTAIQKTADLRPIGTHDVGASFAQYEEGHFNNLYSYVSLVYGGATYTASTTQTQGQTPISGNLAHVSVVANANDVVTLPAAVAWSVCRVKNTGANVLQVFPASSDAIENESVDASITIAVDDALTLVAIDGTTWKIF